MSRRNDNLALLKREARLCVATAKLAEYDHQCHVISASIVPDRKQEAVDFLHDLAMANSLIRIHGQELVESIIAHAFATEGGA